MCVSVGGKKDSSMKLLLYSVKLKGRNNEILIHEDIVHKGSSCLRNCCVYNMYIITCVHVYYVIVYVHYTVWLYNAQVKRTA